MKIRIKIDGPADGVALQIWDIYYAYEQFRARQVDYRCDLDIIISNTIELAPDTINVAWYHGPQSLPKDTHKFDLIFVDLGQHSLETCTQPMYDLLVQNDNCYFVCASYVTENHPWRHKIIWLPMIFNMVRYLTTPFYPQYWEKKSMPDNAGTKITLVNGQNRVHRQYFMDLVTNMSVDVDIINTFCSKLPIKMKDSFFESQEDTLFREFANGIDFIDLPDNVSTSYYDASVPIGINKKFGTIPPGYFIMNVYHDSACVVFPESTWLNDTLWPTEKILKCFVSCCIPWPIGGSNTHHLYNELGYQTAWNLLPDSMQSFDKEKNHQRRYQHQTEAIAWASRHPEIWQSEKAQTIRQQNLQNYVLNNLDGRSAARLHEIFAAL